MSLVTHIQCVRVHTHTTHACVVRVSIYIVRVCVCVSQAPLTVTSSRARFE